MFQAEQLILLVAFGAVDEPLGSCMIASLEWDFIYLLSFLASVHGFVHETSDFLLHNNFFIYQLFRILIYRRRSLYSFFLKQPYEINNILVDEFFSKHYLQVIVTDFEMPTSDTWMVNCLCTDMLFSCLIPELPHNEVIKHQNDIDSANDMPSPKCHIKPIDDAKMQSSHIDSLSLFLLMTS